MVVSKRQSTCRSIRKPKHFIPLWSLCARRANADCAGSMPFVPACMPRQGGWLRPIKPMQIGRRQHAVMPSTIWIFSTICCLAIITMKPSISLTVTVNSFMNRAIPPLLECWMHSIAKPCSMWIWVTMNRLLCMVGK